MATPLGPPRKIDVRGRIAAHLKAPPSKSVTQRALILAALADTPSTLLEPLDADDTRRMAAALNQLGIPVHIQSGQWVIEGQSGRIPNSPAVLDTGDAGTAARFLTALVVLGNGAYRVDGSARMRERPMAPLVDALRSLGVDARCTGRKGCPPIEIQASGLPGGSTRVAGEHGSQFLSALLLASPRALAPLRLEAVGRVASAPYIRLTLGMMEAFSVAPRQETPSVFHQPAPRSFPGRELKIEGDYSSAGYFFAAAAVTGGTARVTNLLPESSQADRALLDALEKMGCRVEKNEDGWTVTGGELKGVDLDLSDMPDAAQTLAVTALFATGPSRLTGLSTLRIKETDRVGALARELGKLGGEVREGPDFLEIRPRPVNGADIETYRDHRMAMSFALAGLRVEGVRILEPDCVGKSFPGFWEEFGRL